MTQRLLTAAALILATLVLVALLTQGNFKTNEGSTVPATSILLLCAYLVLVSGGIYTAFQENAGQLLKYAAVWVGIGGILALIYMVSH